MKHEAFPDRYTLFESRLLDTSYPVWLLPCRWAGFIVCVRFGLGVAFDTLFKRGAFEDDSRDEVRDLLVDLEGFQR